MRGDWLIQLRLFLLFSSTYVALFRSIFFNDLHISTSAQIADDCPTVRGVVKGVLISLEGAVELNWFLNIEAGTVFVNFLSWSVRSFFELSKHLSDILNSEQLYYRRFTPFFYFRSQERWLFNISYRYYLIYLVKCLVPAVLWQ